MKKSIVEKIVDFLSDNKYLLICVTIAVIAIYTNLIVIVLNILLFLGAVGIGAYLDKNQRKVKQIIELFKSKTKEDDDE